MTRARPQRPLHPAGPPPPRAGEELGLIDRARFLTREAGEGDHEVVEGALPPHRAEDRSAAW